jgi:hypothetical protein
MSRSAHRLSAYQRHVRVVTADRHALCRALQGERPASSRPSRYERSAALFTPWHTVITIFIGSGGATQRAGSPPGSAGRWLALAAAR